MKLARELELAYVLLGESRIWAFLILISLRTIIVIFFSTLLSSKGDKEAIMFARVTQTKEYEIEENWKNRDDFLSSYLWVKKKKKKQLGANKSRFCYLDKPKVPY